MGGNWSDEKMFWKSVFYVTSAFKVQILNQKNYNINLEPVKFNLRALFLMDELALCKKFLFIECYIHLDS